MSDKKQYIIVDPSKTAEQIIFGNDIITSVDCPEIIKNLSVKRTYYMSSLSNDNPKECITLYYPLINHTLNNKKILANVGLGIEYNLWPINSEDKTKIILGFYKEHTSPKLRKDTNYDIPLNKIITILHNIDNQQDCPFKFEIEKEQYSTMNPNLEKDEIEKAITFHNQAYQLNTAHWKAALIYDFPKNKDYSDLKQDNTIVSIKNYYKSMLKALEIIK